RLAALVEAVLAPLARVGQGGLQLGPPLLEGQAVVFQGADVVTGAQLAAAAAARAVAGAPGPVHARAAGLVHARVGRPATVLAPPVIPAPWRAVAATARHQQGAAAAAPLAGVHDVEGLQLRGEAAASAVGAGNHVRRRDVGLLPAEEAVGT